jgi:phenylpyruvate C(3)-methyltransferase
MDEWEVALADSGWRCVERRTIDLPAFSFIYRLVPA